MKPNRKCADCLHRQTRKELCLIDVHMCAAPLVTDDVTGLPRYRAHEMRGALAPCGPRARLFVASVAQPVARAPLMSVERIATLFGNQIKDSRA